MLDGTFTGCDEERIIARLVGQGGAGEGGAGQGGTPSTGPGGRPAADGRTGDGRVGDADDDHCPARRSAEQSTNPEETGRAGRGNPTGDSGDGQSTAPAIGASDNRGRRARARPVGVELRVKLSTMLGLDRHPAEIAGWGYTHAEQARAIAAAQTGAQWRYAICDDRGALLHQGLIQSRPHGYPARTPRRGVVEIQIPLSLLRHLFAHPEPHPPWKTIIEQITHDIAAEPGDDESRTPDETGPTSDQRDRPSHGDTAGRDRRFPTSGMRRNVQVRDRHCQFPGCRMPARDTDTDHLRRWSVDGRTLEPNLVSLCRHDHRIKDEGGWRLTRPYDSLLQWTSRLGLTYTVRRPPIIITLPGPRPGRRSTRHAPERPTGHQPAVPERGDPTPHSRETPAPIWWGPHGPGGDEETDAETAQATRANPGEDHGAGRSPRPFDPRSQGPDDGEEVPF